MYFPVFYPEFLTFQHVAIACEVIEGQHAEAKKDDVEDALNYLFVTEAYMHLQGSHQRAVIEYARSREAE